MFSVIQFEKITFLLKGSSVQYAIIPAFSNVKQILTIKFYFLTTESPLRN